MVRVILFISLLFIVSCKENRATTKFSHSFFHVSTIIDISLYRVEKELADSLWVKADSIFDIYEDRFRTENSNSEIYRINHRDNDTVEVSDLLYSMIVKANQFSIKTEGRFDITVYPLKQFWKPECVECREPVVNSEPTKKVIDSLLKKVDYRNVKTSIINGKKSVIFANSSTNIDIGGVAKGFLIRDLSKLITDMGIKNYLINAGGDILANGSKDGKSLYRIGIKSPRESDKIAAIVSINNGAVVTSGDYERFRIDSLGNRVHHLFDSRTGFPITKNRSVTVVAPSAVDADILSTAIFAMDSKDAISFMEKNRLGECCIIDSIGKIYFTSNFPIML